MSQRSLVVALAAVVFLPVWVFFLDAFGFLFLVSPGTWVPPPIPPPVFTDSCDPGGVAARLAIADPATRIAVPWTLVIRASLRDSASNFIEPSTCSGTEVQIDYVSPDLHSTFLQLCERVGRLGWTAQGPPGARQGAVGSPIKETCSFTRQIAGRDADLEVDRFDYDGVTPPSVVLFLNGPDNPQR